MLSQYDIHDRACLLALSDPSGLACTWLQVLPSPQPGLAIPPAEFVVALRLWLGIPVFSEMDPSACSCHQFVDCFGDHIIGCSHGPLHIRRLCDIIYFALLEDIVLMFVGNRVCLVDQRTDQVMYFTQIFTMVAPHILMFL